MIKKICILGLILATAIFISGCTEQNPEPVNNTTPEVVPTEQLLAEATPTEDLNTDLTIASNVMEENMTVEELTDEEVLALENAS
jgi:PBP1b-binding outer membrane lipoprotein LpoB